MILSFLYVFLVLITITSALLLMMRWDRSVRVVERDRSGNRCEWKLSMNERNTNLQSTHHWLHFLVLSPNPQKFQIYKLDKNLFSVCQWFLVQKPTRFKSFCFMDFLFFLFLFGFLPLFFIWLIARMLMKKQRQIVSVNSRESMEKSGKTFSSGFLIFWTLKTCL